jgi:aspartate aminotransferase
MSHLSNRIHLLSESQTIKMAAKSRELTAQGLNIINLSLGEPNFNTPDHIKQAAKKALDDGFTFYTPISGFLDLRHAISRKFKRENNLDYAADQIVVSTGAKQAIANAVLCLVNPGDEVIIPAPYWASYIEITKLAGGIPIIVEATVLQDFKITPEQLKAAITDKTKLIIFSTPCNPTGTVYTTEELKALGNVIVQKEELYILSDEIYEHINFIGKHHSIAEIDFMKERTVVVNGMSKGYAMTGWRIGYMAAPKWLAQACDKIQAQFTSGTCAISQRAALTALDADNTFTLEMCKAFQRRRDMVLEGMKEIPGFVANKPSGAFYIFPDISYYFSKSFKGEKINTATDLCMYLLAEAHVALVSGEAFGNGNCIRFSYAASEENLTEALKRIKTALAQLQ